MFEEHKDKFYLVFRVLVGLLFAQHGLQKFGLLNGPGLAGFASFAGLPIWLAFVVAIVETVGGLAIAIGLFTSWVSIVTAIEMLFAYFMVHIPNGLIPILNGGELALLYFACFVYFVVKGSGEYSIDKMIT